MTKLPDVLGLELSAIIERRIIYLEIKPGAHVTEQEICDEFNISRSPVREAFRNLEANGLVIRHARRGIRVTPMTQEDLEAIYFCRIPLEGLAAACAATNATDAEVAHLKEMLGVMSAKLKDSDATGFFDANVAFINRVHESTGNKVLASILAVIEKQALRYRYFAHISTPRMLDNSFAGLNDIYAAVQSRNPARAKRVAINLMKEAKRIISAALAESGNVGETSPARAKSRP